MSNRPQRTPSLHPDEKPRPRCSQCKRSVLDKPTLSVIRQGGGNYRRASRNFRTTICLDCAREVAAYRASQIERNVGLSALYGGLDVRNVIAALQRYDDFVARHNATQES